MQLRTALVLSYLLLPACGSDEPSDDSTGDTSVTDTESDASGGDDTSADAGEQPDVGTEDADENDTDDATSGDDATSDATEDATTDAETDAAEGDVAETDVGDDADGGGDVDADAGADGCIEATIDGIWSGERADDVSIGFNGFYTPTIDGYSSQLTLLFERYTPGPDVGVFELGPGTRDENYGNCAHCVVVQSAGTTAFFASSGTLETRRDPYSRFLDAVVTDLRLDEVDVDPATRESTPIEGGRCIEFADFQVTQSFPATGWTCPEEQYNDGEFCHCDCGDFDPDCAPEPDCFPLDPECEIPEPLPVVNCEEAEVCAFDPEAFSLVCTEPCDWAGGVGCTTGVCVYDFGSGDGSLCIDSDERIDAAGLGETCAPGSIYQKFCNVVDGFAQGYCDFDGTCQPMCETDEECTDPTHTCRLFVFDGDLGYCGPEPVDEE